LRARERAEHSPGWWRTADVGVVVFFVVSRLVYRLVFDVRFDSSPPSYFAQYIDPWFVEHDFARSVLYLHHQAPLQVLVVQGCIKLLGMARATVVLQGLYLALGLSLTLVFLRVLRSLGAPVLPAVVAASLYTAWPTYILYENWLFYSVPTAAVFAFALLALLRYYRNGTLGAALVFFSLLAVLALLRSTFGAVFIGAAAGILLLRPPAAPWGAARRTILKAAALPLLVVTLNMAKTSWLIGHSYGSALLWQNLCPKIFLRLPYAEQKRLTDSGIVSNAADYRGVLSVAGAYGRFQVPYTPTGVPLLDLEATPGGDRNPHALEHVLVAEKYYRPDAIYLLTHYPGAYLGSVWEAISTQYVRSAVDVDILQSDPNAERLRTLRSVADRALGRTSGGQLVALAVGLPLACLYGAYRIVRRRAALMSERASTVAVSFMLLAIGYAGSVTLLVSWGDFARYRFDVDALYFMLLLLCGLDASSMARRAFRALVGARKRRARRASPFVSQATEVASHRA